MIKENKRNVSHKLMQQKGHLNRQKVALHLSDTSVRMIKVKQFYPFKQSRLKLIGYVCLVPS